MKDCVEVIEKLEKGIRVEEPPYGMGNPFSNEEEITFHERESEKLAMEYWREMRRRDDGQVRR